MAARGNEKVQPCWFCLRLTKERRRARRVLRVALLSLAIWSFIAWVAARGLMTNADLKRADALVVLAGSGTYLERTQQAARLFNEGRAPKIILTNDNLLGGWSEVEQRNPLFVERAVEELQRRGVPAERIQMISLEMSGTYEEAVRLREYATAHDLQSVLVVTSAYHSRRALWTLHRVFRGSATEIGLYAVAPGAQSPSPGTWWWYPIGWKMVPGEYLKMLYYLIWHH